MKQPDPAMRDLARRLLTLEGGESEASEMRIDVASSALAKLRLYLSKLVGVAGFSALLARALALAKAEVPWLESVRVNAEGALEDFAESAQQQDANAAVAGMTALLEQLLGLLETFIGKDLTLRLVRDVWSEASLNDKNVSAEETPE